MYLWGSVGLEGGQTTDSLIPFGVTSSHPHPVKVTATEGQPLPVVPGPCLIPFSSMEVKRGVSGANPRCTSPLWASAFSSVKWES